MDTKSSKRRPQGYSVAVARVRPPAVARRRRWRGFRFGGAFVPLLVIAIMLVVFYDLSLTADALR